MAIYTIGDLHLSFHENKPMSIFGDNWKGYEEKIKKDWIQKIKETDLVILPGDFSWSTYLSDTKEDFEYLNSLPGKKLLLKGNHDYWWTTITSMRNFLKENKFDNIDSIRVFINNNNIKSRTEFKKKYNGLYWKSVRSGWIHDIKFEKDMKDWSYYDSIVKVQNFIYSNNILNHDQFSKEYPGLLSKCDRNRWSIYLNYINGKINNWNNINSIIKK